jgi:putative ABC transport system substrate-binding protein
MAVRRMRRTSRSASDRVLGTESSALWKERLAAFHEGLGNTGFVEGRTVAVEYKPAEGQYDRLGALAADLVRNKVKVIVTGANPNAGIGCKGRHL